MDKTDALILKILSQKANATATEIGEKVGLSVPAVNKRILKLQKDGIIKNFTIITSAKKSKKANYSIYSSCYALRRWDKFTS